MVTPLLSYLYTYYFVHIIYYYKLYCMLYYICIYTHTYIHIISLYICVYIVCPSGPGNASPWALGVAVESVIPLIVGPIILYTLHIIYTVSHHHTQCHIIIHTVTSSYIYITHYVTLYIMYVCKYACMYVRTCVRTCVCMYLCMHACICMCVCVCVCVSKVQVLWQPYNTRTIFTHEPVITRGSLSPAVALLTGLPPRAPLPHLSRCVGVLCV
jgi:hypothetical protein